jgi:hypothetical protein
MLDENSKLVYKCPVYGRTETELLHICRSVYFFSKTSVDTRIKYFQVSNRKEIEIVGDSYTEECVDNLIVVKNGKYHISIPEECLSQVEILVGNKKCELKIAQ